MPGIVASARLGIRYLAGAMLAGLLALPGCAHKGPAPVESRERYHRVVKHGPQRRPATHRVVRGDTLYSIAWRYGLDFRRLAQWNGIESPYRIFPGQSLRLHAPAGRVAGNPGQGGAATRRVRERMPPAPASAAKPSSAPRPAPAPTPVRQGPLRWMWPAQGKLVQTFRKGDRTRQGIRIAGKVGQPILAAEAGRVVYSGSGLPGYGQLIIIKHDNNYLSAYGFNRKIMVRDAERVARGERVAEMGRAADGTPLLHFEIRRSDVALDPLRLLPRR